MVGGCARLEGEALARVARMCDAARDWHHRQWGGVPPFVIERLSVNIAKVVARWGLIEHQHCPVCGAEFFPEPRRRGQRYCSVACKGSAWIGVSTRREVQDEASLVRIVPRREREAA